jgi:hypothetical protein
MHTVTPTNLDKSLIINVILSSENTRPDLDPQPPTTFPFPSKEHFILIL